MFNADGTAFGAEFLVNTTIANNQHAPSVAALSSGGDTAGAAIRAQAFAADGTPSGDEFRANVTTAMNQTGPSVTELADGRIVITVTDASSTGGDPAGQAARGIIHDPGTAVANLDGTDGSDVWHGTEWADTMNGGGGDDRIDGGLGRDVLSGSAGADTFEFGRPADSRPGALRDIITDFEHGVDTIDLAGIDARTGAGNQAFTFIGGAGFSGTAGELRFSQTANAMLIQADRNGDGAGDFEILLMGVIALDADDFILWRPVPRTVLASPARVRRLTCAPGSLGEGRNRQKPHSEGDWPVPPAVIAFCG